MRTKIYFFLFEVLEGYTTNSQSKQAEEQSFLLQANKHRGRAKRKFLTSEKMRSNKINQENEMKNTHTKQNTNNIIVVFF